MGLALGTVLRRVPPEYSERESRAAKPELATCEDFSVARNPRASCEMEHPQSVLRYRFAAEAHRSVLRNLLIFRHLRWPVSGSHQVYCSVIIAGENWDAAYIAIGVCSSVPQRALPRISSDSHSTQNKRFFTWIFSTPGKKASTSPAMSRPEFAPFPSSPRTTGVSDALALDRNWILGAVMRSTNMLPNSVANLHARPGNLVW